MTAPISILLIEDDANDAKLLELALQDANCVAEITRVETEKQMQAQLTSQDFDIVLSDFSLPSFSGTQALRCLKQTGLDIPFVMVSGTLGEERAIQMMKEGVADFVQKDKLFRLPPVVLREVKESKNRKEKRKIEKNYKSIVETANEGVLLLTPKGEVIFSNAFARKLLGETPEGLIGECITKYLERPQAFSDTLKTLLKAEKAEKRDFKFKRPDGSEIWGMVATALFEKEPDAKVLAMISDVTQRKKDEQEKRKLLYNLREAIAARDDFLSVASHELKTPLTPLLLQINMLQDFTLQGDPSTWDKAELTQALELMVKHINKLNEIVEDLLAVTRFRAGKVTPTKERTDLVPLIKEVLEKYTPQIEEAGSYVTFQSANEVWADIDKKQIETLVTNLLTNAIKYGNGKSVEVFLEEDAKDVKISVKDHGFGIAKEDLKRIFN